MEREVGGSVCFEGSIDGERNGRKKRHDRKERNSSEIGEEMRETEIRAG